MSGEAMGKQASQSLLMEVSKVMALGKGKSANSAFTLDPETLPPGVYPTDIPAQGRTEHGQMTADWTEVPNKRGLAESIMAPPQQ